MARSITRSRPPPPPSSSRCSSSSSAKNTITTPSLRLCLIRLFAFLAALTMALDFYFLVVSNQRVVVSSRPLLIQHHHHHHNHGAAAAEAIKSGVSRAPPDSFSISAAAADSASSSSSFQQQQQQEQDADATVAVSTVDPVVVALFNASGILLDAATIQRLPTWKQVTDLYGTHPVMAGFQPAPPLLQSSLQSQSQSAQEQEQQQQQQASSPQLSFQASCTEYRARVPAERRMLGAAGLFSTGTNLITTLLKNNCQIPERVALYGEQASREQHGMRWQVPWGKHTPAHYKTLHAATHATNINKDDVLPIVTIRHPYWWMHSMCKNPYTTHWHVRRKNRCPDLRLLEEPELKNNHHHQPEDLPLWNNVTVKYGAGSEQYQSLVHLFNDWYHEYTELADYPWVS
jgi:hypothetical protein